MLTDTNAKRWPGTVETVTNAIGSSTGEAIMTAKGVIAFEASEIKEITMLENTPSQAALPELLGESLYAVWQGLVITVEEAYDMERLWAAGGKNWTYEYKYRRGGKTLCCLYAARNRLGFMLIFGKEERARVEAIRGSLSAAVCKAYDEAKTYHDGKWVMFEPTDTLEFEDYLRLLAIKRKPNRR